MCAKKKSGKNASGDPRKHAAAAKKETRLTKTRVERTLKLHEFIDMENLRDVQNLREEAIEEKATDMGDEFWSWYIDKTGADAAEFNVITFQILYFFDALLEFGKAAPESGNLNFDDIVSYLKDPANADVHMETKWNDFIEKYLLSYLKEFCK